MADFTLQQKGAELQNLISKIATAETQLVEIDTRIEIVKVL